MEFWIWKMNDDLQEMHSMMFWLILSNPCNKGIVPYD